MNYQTQNKKQNPKSCSDFDLETQLGTLRSLVDEQSEEMNKVEFRELLKKTEEEFRARKSEKVVVKLEVIFLSFLSNNKRSLNRNTINRKSKKRYFFPTHRITLKKSEGNYCY